MTIADLIRDLEALRDGKMNCEVFRSKYLRPNSPGNVDSLPDIVGNLSHYIDDEDLREKDPAYKRMQNSELEKLVVLLKKGAPDKDLQRITFLGQSK